MTLIDSLIRLDGRIGRKTFWTGSIVLIALFLTAVLVHDRNKSGWWALVFIFLPGAADRWSDRLTEDTPLWWVLVLIGSVLTIWGLIELGFRRGTDGDNDYGPDPLAQRESGAQPEPSR